MSGKIHRIINLRLHVLFDPPDKNVIAFSSTRLHHTREHQHYSSGHVSSLPAVRLRRHSMTLGSFQ